jgi:hypothetical protein
VFLELNPGLYGIDWPLRGKKRISREPKKKVKENKRIGKG